MSHFEQFLPIKDIIYTKHFHRDWKDFDAHEILLHPEKTGLHKYEMEIDGCHIFRALENHTHIVFAIDKEHNMILLRAFKNFKEYEKYLEHIKIG